MIESRSDLISLLREYGAEGCPFERLQREGLVTPISAAQELKARGYDVRVLGTGGGTETALRQLSGGRGEEAAARPDDHLRRARTGPARANGPGVSA